MWNQLYRGVSPTSTFIVSLCSPEDEPDQVFLDLRRSFLKDGVVIPKKNGVRVRLNSGDFILLMNRLELVLMGIQRYTELNGLSFQRGGTGLLVKKMVDVAAVPLRLSREEANFTFRTLSDVLANWSSIMAGEEDSDVGGVALEAAVSWL